MTPFADNPQDTVSALGEERLIARIRLWLGKAAPPPPAGPGDDCALLKPRKGTRLVVTADPVVLGRHFDGTTSPALVARKLLRRNLSDIAAMGGTPRFAILTWTMPQRTSVDWLAAFHRALSREALKFGVTINGGDISGASADLAAHLTLIGEAPENPLLRTGARVGDQIYVTGELGGSILGRHLLFEPRLEEGRWLAGHRGVRCLIDVSDGIAKELRLITPRGARASIDRDAVPVSSAARKFARQSGRPALEHALGDGEDFELLFAVAPANARSLEAKWRKKFSTRITCIGEFVKAGASPSSAPSTDELAGFDHLKRTSP